jgi:hypothetical protein
LSGDVKNRPSWASIRTTSSSPSGGKSHKRCSCPSFFSRAFLGSQYLRRLGDDGDDEAGGEEEARDTGRENEGDTEEGVDEEGGEALAAKEEEDEGEKEEEEGRGERAQAGEA